MRLTLRPFRCLSVLVTLAVLSACVLPGGNRAVNSAVNPVSGTTVTVETVAALPKAKPAKPTAAAPIETVPLAAPAAKPAKAAAPAAKPAAPAAKPAAPPPLPKAKTVRKVIKTKDLPDPVAGQVDASLDAITAAEAAAPDEAAAAPPKPTEEAPNPKTPEEVAAEALLAATAAEPQTPVELQSPEQAQCLKKGGVWATAGKSGAKACVKRTKDAGKSCTRQTQCEGFCLARSGTCAPITPIFGCTEILQADGREVTLCLD